MNESVCISPRRDHHAVTDEQFVFNRYSFADKRFVSAHDDCRGWFADRSRLACGTDGGEKGASIGSGATVLAIPAIGENTTGGRALWSPKIFAKPLWPVIQQEFCLKLKRG